MTSDPQPAAAHAPTTSGCSCGLTTTDTTRLDRHYDAVIRAGQHTTQLLAHVMARCPDCLGDAACTRHWKQARRMP